MEKIPVIAVVGPTASGKTTLGIRVATAYGGEIISADSMQIYRGMDIASAKPTAAERAAVPHHLIDFVAPERAFSVAEYVTLADRAAKDIAGRGKKPVIVGGTGLYVNSFLNHIQFFEEDTSKQVRARLSEEYDRLGGEALWNHLCAIDPEAGEKLHPNDRKRILRALEIYELTGERKSARDQAAAATESPYAPVFIGLRFTDRSLLYERIDRRVDLMAAQGLVEEARLEYRQDKGRTAVQAIGHKELFPYFEGEISLADALENLKRQTRRYAKRQMTWFSRNERIHWMECDGKSLDEVFEQAVKILDASGFHRL